jgi:hypothetical protein
MTPTTGEQIVMLVGGILVWNADHFHAQRTVVAILGALLVVMVARRNARRERPRFRRYVNACAQLRALRRRDRCPTSSHSS